MRNAVGIFGGVAGAIVVALVARYGFATSDTALDGAIAAFFFAVIAIGGIGGPAVAVHLFRSSEGWGKTWGAIAGVIAVVALLANLSNSLGAIAGRADKTLAERASAKDASKDGRTELERLTREREALPTFTPASADDAQAARSAVTAAEKVTTAECGDGTNPKQRGPRCREKEAEEKAKRDALSTVLTSKGLTDKAAKIDTEAAAARRKIEKAPPVTSVNPMAETLARIFHIHADDAATWQQVATVIVVELLIAFALIAFELLAAPKVAIPNAGVSVSQPPSLMPEPENGAGQDVGVRQLASVAASIAIEPAAPRQRRQRKPVTPMEAGLAPGDVAKFAVACLRPAVGASVAIPALYRPYSEWCEQHGFRAVDAAKFDELFAALCDLSGFSRSETADEVCCLNLELAA